MGRRRSIDDDRSGRAPRALALALAVAVVAAAPAGAATVHVDLAGTDQAGCGSFAGAAACRSLPYAVARATVGDTVQIGVGEFNASPTAAGGALPITKRLTLLGAQAGNDARARDPDSPAETVLVATPLANGGTMAIVHITASGSVIDGITFRGNTLGGGVRTGGAGVGGHTIVNSIFARNRYGTYPETDGADTVLAQNLFVANNADPGKPGAGNGFYAQVTRNLTIRDNAFRDNDQSGAIDTRPVGTRAGGSDVTFLRNTIANESGPVFVGIDGLTVADNVATGGPRVGMTLGGDGNDDVHVLRNVLTGQGQVGINLNFAAGVQNGSVEIRENTILRVGGDPVFGVGVRISPTGAIGPVTVVNNRIVDNANAGLRVEDPDARVVARDNWWGCNAGPGQPGCNPVTAPAGNPVAFAPWMVLTLAADPLTIGAGDSSTLAADLANLSDGARPTPPFFPTAVALFGATPPGTHVPERVPLGGDALHGESRFTAGAEPPDELRTTVDNQTVRIRLSRPPKPDIVPVVTPADPTLDPGEATSLAVAVVNEGNRSATQVRACLELSERLEPGGERCVAIPRLRPGHARHLRARVRARLDACRGPLAHRLRVTSAEQPAVVRSAPGRLRGAPCGPPPRACGSSSRVMRCHAGSPQSRPRLKR